MARPFKDDKRLPRTTLKATKFEWEVIQKHVEESGLSTNEYLIRRAMKKQIKTTKED